MSALRSSADVSTGVSGGAYTAASAAARPDVMPRISPAGAAPFTPEQAHCEHHGPYPLNAVDADGTVRWHAPHCPACARTRTAEKLLARAAIAPRFAHCRFDNFDATTPEQQDVLQACRDYAHHFAHWSEHGLCLIFSGNPGTGKNHLATAIARALLKGGHTVLNATAHEIVQRIRDTWRANRVDSGRRDGGAENEGRVLREFAVADLLIIDEVGRAYQHREGHEPVELFNVIDARYRELRPTLVISNQDADGIMQALGLAAYDRLLEGGGQLLRFSWASHRK